MILIASQRGNAAQLSRHLLNARDNEHVELHEVRGFVADDLEGALMEAEAVSNGTRCKKFLLSVSFDPPKGAEVPTENFEAAIEMAEQKLGLEGQPRAIVFHEKEGRRHAHVVWSRIDARTMTARQLPYYKNKLMDVAKELFLEHGWEMPKGLLDRNARDPLSFSRDEWQQAKRMQRDARLIKAVFQQCWSRSDSARAFRSALESHGYFLCRGDKRGFIALDIDGEPHAISKWAGVRAKEVRARLGDLKNLPSVDDTRAMIAARMTDKLRGFAEHVRAEHKRRGATVEHAREAMVARHREERTVQERQQDGRWIDETNARAARLPKGLGSLWSRITGRYSKIRRQNEYEAWRSYMRDQAEKDALIARQLEERQNLQHDIDRVREAQAKELQRLNQDIGRYVSMAEQPPEMGEHSRDASRHPAAGLGRDAGRDSGFEPEL